MIDKYNDLLRSTLEVQTKSKEEKRMKKFIRSYLRKQGLDTEHDDKGNIYCHKGDKRKNRPFVVAHMDTVHNVNSGVKVFDNGEFLYAFDMSAMKQVGVGGDDKVGVWAALAALTEFDDISAAFFVQEEIGCIGSGAANMDQFKKANWLAQLDRREDEDFIVSSMASEDFIEDMTPIVESFAMTVTRQSTVTDVATLYRRRVGVSCVNIASGYWFPHRDQEVVRWDSAINALSLLFTMIRTKGEAKYPHLPPKPKKNKKTKVMGFRGSKSGGSLRWDGRKKWDGYRYNSNSSAIPLGGSVDDFEIVGETIRTWNAAYGCYMWKDLKGELLYFEGAGINLGIFSLSPALVSGGYKSQPKGDTLSTVFPTQKQLKDSVTVDILGMMYGDEAAVETISDDNVYDDMEDYFKRRDQEDLERSIAKANGDIKSYHNFEAERESKKSDVNVDPAARMQVEQYLYMFSHSWHELIHGQIADSVVHNISASLYYDTGLPMQHYAEMFGFSSMYTQEALENTGVYKSFSNGDTGDMDDIPF